LKAGMAKNARSSGDVDIISYGDFPPSYVYVSMEANETPLADFHSHEAVIVYAKPGT